MNESTPRILMIAPTTSLSKDRRILQTCNSLAEAGSQVDVILPPQNDEFKNQLPSYLNPKIRLHEIPTNYSDFASQLDFGDLIPFRYRSWLVQFLMKNFNRIVKGTHTGGEPTSSFSKRNPFIFKIYWGRVIPFLYKIGWGNFYFLACQLGPYRYLRFRGLCSLSYLNPWYFAKSIEISKGIAPDIIYCHDLWSLGSACCLKSIWKVPIIFDAHDIASSIKGDETLTANAQRYEKQGYQMVDLFITVNQSVAAYFREHFPRLDPQVIVNAPRYWKKKPSAANIKKIIGNEEAVVGVFVGNLNHSPRLEALIDSISLTKRNIALVIVGSGNAAKGIETYATQKGLLNSRVFLLGAVPYSEVMPLISSADFGIIPDIQNWVNFGLNSPAKMYDYIQAELPIFSDRGIEVDRILGRYNNGITYDLSAPAPQVADHLDHFCSSLEQFAAGVQIAKNTLVWPVDFFDKTVGKVLDSRKV